MPENHWYKFYPGDWIRDTGDLTLEEKGAYFTLINHYYSTRQPIPTDIHKLKRILNTTLQKTRKFLPIFRRFFEEKNDLFHHKKIDFELDKALKKSEIASANAHARWHADSMLPEPEPDKDSNVVDIKNISTTSSDSPSAKSDRVAVPFQEIVKLYHKLLPMLARVEKLTTTRQGFIRQRWQQDLPDLEHWSNYFNYVSKSKFLIGLAPPIGDKPPFRADLEWLTRPSNYAKVAEEKYHRG